MKTDSNKTSSIRTWTQQLQTIIKRRKMLVVMIISAFLVLLVLYNVGNFIFLNQISNQLEQELELRLTSVTKLATTVLESEIMETLTEDERNRLQGIRTQHQLEGLYIIDENYNTILDSYRDFELTIKRTYLVDDSLWINQAWQGLHTSGPLHILDDQKFKSAYSPVRNYYGEMIGILVAEANVDFFDLLEAYRSTFFITVLISAGVFVFLQHFSFLPCDYSLKPKKI